MIIAKPVVDKQYWILQEDNRKIGNVEACDGGYQVKIRNKIQQYKTIKMVEQRVQVQFEPAVKTPRVKTPATYSVYGYPTASRVYNGIWNVPKKLPMYTKTNKSKSWYAAGWYCVKQGRNWESLQDPKLIVLQRYPYQGPFMSQEQADGCTR
jgi:hypothetical protein